MNLHYFKHHDGHINLYFIKNKDRYSYIQPSGSHSCKYEDACLLGYRAA